MYKIGLGSRLVLGLACALMVACSGAIGGDSAGSGGGSDDPAGGTGSMPNNLPQDTPPASLPPDRMMSTVCKGIEPGPTYVRRLTKNEYNNVINHLAGDTSSPAKDFPTETQIEGWDNNGLAQTVSPVLLEQYLLIAEREAQMLVDTKLAALMGNCDVATKGEPACLMALYDNFGRRAFRRPLAADEIALLKVVFDVGKTTGGTNGFKNGIRLVVTEMLLSPPFLYRIEFGMPAKPGETVVRLDHYEMASRLSFLVWNSMPDDMLFTAAKDSKLGTAAEISAQAMRMIGDGKAKASTRHFYEQWLDLDRLDNLMKDAVTFRTWSGAIASAMRTETLRFADEVTWNDSSGDITALLTATYSFMTKTLATFYGGVTAPADDTTFARVDLNAMQRGGVLTQGALMAGLAHENQTSPVVRGLFVREQFLCTHPPAPPDDIQIVIPKLDPTKTTRERFAVHTNLECARACHTLMDPIGLGFENFDAVGKYRTTEAGKRIDATGEIIGLASMTGDAAKFNGPLELGRKLASADEVRSCVGTKWFQYSLGRTQDTNSDACSLDVLKRRFSSNNYKLKDLLMATVQTDAFLFRRVITAGGAQ